MRPVPSHLNNTLAARLKDGDASVVAPLVALGFGPFDTLASVDQQTIATPRTVWQWACSAPRGQDQVLLLLTQALVSAVRARPNDWADAIRQAWTQDAWGLWAIDVWDAAPPVSSRWDLAWRTALESLTLTIGDTPSCTPSDPGFWSGPAGTVVVRSLAHQLAKGPLDREVDRVWERLIALGMIPDAWDQACVGPDAPTGKPAETPLGYAARQGEWAMVARLARYGVKPNAHSVLTQDEDDPVSMALPVTALGLCMQGLVLSFRMDNPHAVPNFCEPVARAITALLDAGADLDVPTGALVRCDAPLDGHHPQHRYHDDHRQQFCSCAPWAGSPTVREVLRAWVDHPSSHAMPSNGMIDGIPQDLVHGWRVRLDEDLLRATMGDAPTVTTSAAPRARL